MNTRMGVLMLRCYRAWLLLCTIVLYKVIQAMGFLKHLAVSSIFTLSSPEHQNT